MLYRIPDLCKPARRTILKRLSYLLMFCLAFVAPLLHGESLKLPDMGDPSSTVLSPEEDRLLGQAFMRSVRRALNLVDDVEIHTYINTLGYKLLAHTDTTQTRFSFFVVDQPSINAFAGPGGYIGIHTGLILEAQSEGELAAVMAHEIVHVTQRHLARAFQKASTANFQTAAAILAAIILGSIDPQAAQAVIVAATAGNIQQQLNFTRAHEREADWLGIDILARAGYSPDYMATFFKRLQEASRYSNSAAIPELLRTHPVTANRISDAQSRAARYPDIDDNPLPSFQYVQAKLRAAQYHSRPDYMAQLERKVEHTKEPWPLLNYEYALALLANRHMEKAKQVSDKLFKEAPENINFIALQATINEHRGDYDKAEKQLSDALTLYPNHPALTVLYAKALMATQRPELAAQQLRTLINEQGPFSLPMYYRLLAEAQKTANQTVDSHLSLAQYYDQTGQTRPAIQQLENALRLPNLNNSYDRQRIKAKLKQMKEKALQEETLEKGQH